MIQSTLRMLEFLGDPVASPGPPSAFVPPNVSLAVLVLFAAAAGMLAGTAGSALSLFLGRKTLARRLAAVTAAGGTLYLAILFGLAAASRERTLPLGGRKYFCEIDCHLAYSVAGVDRPAGPGGARDSVRIVQVETWFDPSTIASFRGNAPLTPNPRRAFLIDGRGRRFEVSSGATTALREKLSRSVSFTRTLRPGESYRTALVFDLPAGVTGLRLWLGDPTPGVEQFLPGHENSFFHAGVYFDLEERGNEGGKRETGDSRRGAAAAILPPSVAPFPAQAPGSWREQIAACLSAPERQESVREGSPFSEHDPAAVGRIHGGDPGRKRGVFSGALFGPLPFYATSALQGGRRAPPRFSLLHRGLRRHPPRHGACAPVVRLAVVSARCARSRSR